MSATGRDTRETPGTFVASLVVAVVVLALLGALVGLFAGSVAVGALFGAGVGVLVFLGKINLSRAIKDSPEGEDAGYLRKPGGT